MHSSLSNPALILAVATFAGVTAQVLARRLRIPGIVLLLAAGVALGPDGAGLILPSKLGSALSGVVGFGVAVILFEGGMNQDLRRLRREAVAIRRLVIGGALITAAGAALAAYFVMGWDWRMALLFGTLVIVTGPTVITPLLRRIRVSDSVDMVLEAEGIFIDAVGAIIAVAALEFALSPSAASLGESAVSLGVRFATGALVGTAGGIVLVLLIGRWKLVSEGMENIFALALVILVFEASNAIVAESGIAATIVAGMVVGHSGIKALRQLMEFKEQLTVLLIAVLFVLLAADVGLDEVTSLGWRGLITVAMVMFVVRPINVFACTLGTTLNVRERLFLSWLAPRGIVAAAMASLFAHELARAGISGGTEVRALVFMVIAVTVTLQGLSGNTVAHLLGVARPERAGYVLVGANSLARAIARGLASRGVPVTLIDSNDRLCRAAEDEGLRVLYGNVLRERTLLKARVERKAVFAAVTTSEKVNFMAAQLVRRDHPGPRVAIAIATDDSGVTHELVRTADASLLFGGAADLEMWTLSLRKRKARVEPWTWRERDEDDEGPDLTQLDRARLIPLVVCHDSVPSLGDDGVEVRDGDTVEFAILDAERAATEGWLREHGFVPAESS